MPKVLLINPPQTYFRGSQPFGVYFPLGLLYVAASVRDLSDVEIFDCLVRDFAVQELGDSMVYGAPLERVRTEMERAHPDIVGINVPFTAQFENAAAIASLCRETVPKAVVVLGGPDPSIRYERILEDGHADYCVVGEGEDTFREFVSALADGRDPAGIPGVACIRGGSLNYERRPFITALDRLPLPAYDLVNAEEYFESHYLYANRGGTTERSVSLVTSRGCPYDCVFCSVHLHMGRGYRHHSPDQVLRHLRLCIEQYGVRTFHFEDDNLSLSRSRFEAILDGIIGDGLNIQWDTPNGIRTDTLDMDLLRKMKQSGCVRLSLAFESGCQRVLDDVIRKKTSLERMIEVAAMCHRVEIPTHAFFVIGFPGETLAEMRQTTSLALNLKRDLDIEPILMIATPLPGTDLYKTCLREGYIRGELTPRELSACTQADGEPLIATSDFSRDDVSAVARDHMQAILRWRRNSQIRSHLKHPVRSARKIAERAWPSKN
ncbi:MAG: radical SAM protein [Acidobacteriota bacterium]|nr:radical SAM protein [Acidobacteriota bacterium]